MMACLPGREKDGRVSYDVITRPLRVAASPAYETEEMLE